MTRRSKALSKRSKRIRKDKSKNYIDNDEKEEEMSEEKKEEGDKIASMAVDKPQSEINTNNPEISNNNT